jgi:hypothetical protein
MQRQSGSKFLKRLAGVSTSARAFAAAADQVQLPADRALPRKEPKQWPELLLHEPLARKAPHLVFLTRGTNDGFRRRASLSECVRGHQRTTSTGLEQAYYTGIANRRNLTPLSLQVIGDSLSFNRTSPFIASPAMALASVSDAFNDSGRSSRIPTFFAYSLNAISTSYKIST